MTLSEQVAERLRRDIFQAAEQGGNFKLPSERALAREMNVSGVTVRQAIKTLAAEGLVTGRQGSGNYVSDDVIRGRRTVAMVLGHRGEFAPKSPWHPRVHKRICDYLEKLGWFTRTYTLFHVSDEIDKEAMSRLEADAGAGLTTTAHLAIKTGKFSKDIDGISDHTYTWANMPEIVAWGGEHFKKRDGFVYADDGHTYVSQMRLLRETAIKAGRPDFQIWQTEWGFPAYQYDG